MRVAAHAPDAALNKMHWTTKIGVASVVSFMLVVAGLNGIGWINTLPGAGGIAVSFVAVSLELMAFVAWEHLVAYQKAHDHGRFALALIGLALAVLMNVEGGHRGLNHVAAPFYVQAESERRAGQERLDETRRDLEQEIAALQSRIDEVAQTNPGMTYSGRMEQWRQSFELVTAEDRRQTSSLRARLDQLPLSVAAREPYPGWAPYGIAAAFAFFSVFGLTMFGVKVPGPELTVGQSRRAKKVANALRAQAPRAAKERDAAGQFIPAEEIPPLTEEQVCEALKALTESGKVISLGNVARFHKVPVSSVKRSPAAKLVLDKQAWQQITQQMAA
ncbi:MAG: hypothetical protein ABL883_05825 [Terricaulis sp.]